MNKIGFFDSGIGGLSVLHEALRRYPANEYLFFADTDHVPYGVKTEEEIRTFAFDNVRFLVSRGAKAVVVACNTATAAAIAPLRDAFDIPIIGMEPAVKPAVQSLGEEKKRVLVAATPLTLQEEKLKDLLARVDEAHLVDLVALPKLVSFAEEETFDTPLVRDYLAQALSPYKREDYAAMVLGCTHFVYFRPLLRELMGEHVRLFDGNLGTVRRLADVLKLPETGEVTAGYPEKLTGKVIFFESGREVTDKRKAARYMGLLKFLEEISPVLQN